MIGKKLIVILGPTASGKSALGVTLAKKFNGEIISADSRQVYKGINLASGKITKKEMGGITHYCLDIAYVKKHYTVSQWKTCAQKAIKAIHNKNKIPIIVGGTAFYIKAITDEMNIPEVKPNWKLRRHLEKKSPEQLFSMLKKLDLRRAKTIDRHNPRRLIRAIEIIKTTGKPVPKKEPEIMNDQLKGRVLFLGIKIDKNKLKKQIECRLEARFKKGIVSEIKNLHAQGVPWSRLESMGLEPRWIARFLQGKINQKEMKKKLLADIIHFTKKQDTWWKKDKRIHWIHSERKAELLVKNFLNK